MLRFRDWPIRRKLNLAVLLTSGFVLFAACSVFLMYDRLTFPRTLENHLSTLARVIGFNSTAALTFQDQTAARETLGALKTEPHVTEACLYAKDGTVFGRYERPGQQGVCEDVPGDPSLRSEGNFIVSVSPVTLNGETIGTLTIRRDSAETRERAKLYGEVSIFVMLTCLLAAGLISTWIQRLISQPILALADTARQITEKENFSIRTKVYGRDELGRLTEAFNRMLSEIQRRDDRLREQAAHLLELEKGNALGTMAAGVAHELSNPMMGIVNYVQYAMKNVPPDGKVLPVLQDAEREIRRCNRIIQDILLFARSTRVEKEKRHDTDCGELIRQVLKDQQYRLNNEGICVDLRLEGIPKLLLKADTMQRVFLNLIGNAIDAMKGRAEKILTVEATAKNNSLKIEIRDTGSGIPPAVISKIFDPFFTTKPTGQGTGLGLSISRSIIDDHGGKLECETVPGKGTTFSVVLPA